MEDRAQGSPPFDERPNLFGKEQTMKDRSETGREVDDTYIQSVIRRLDELRTVPQESCISFWRAAMRSWALSSQHPCWI